jgi:hypothetical protein
VQGGTDNAQAMGGVVHRGRLTCVAFVGGVPFRCLIIDNPAMMMFVNNDTIKHMLKVLLCCQELHASSE